MANGTDALPMHNGGDCELPLGDQAEMMSPSDEQAQYMYPNGYVDHGVIYLNGSYEWGYDAYGNVTAVVVGPAPHYAGPGGGPPVLAAVPCQPLPLQPLEWFNPAYGMPYVAAAGPMAAAAAVPPSCPRDRDRRKRSSTDSQNCSPQSSESTEPPGSPQEGDGEADPECEGDGDVEGEGEVDGDGDGECGADGDAELEVDDAMAAALPGLVNGVAEYAVYAHPHAHAHAHAHAAQAHGQPQPYVYPGTYMFGPPIYNMNGITVQGTPQPPHCIDNSGSKRRKKKRRRRRRRGGVEDGSEESSSDEKDLEEPVSLTSQESSQELESDSKHSAESVSCPKVVGCTELPVKTPNSPSLSPSPPPPPPPPPPPSPPSTSCPLPNVNEDKTVLPKVNGNTIQDIISVRSDAEYNNPDLAKSTLTSDKLENHLETVVNAHSEKALHNVNEVKVPNSTPNIHEKITPTSDAVLVSNTNKINENHLTNNDKAFDGDNKLLKHSYPLQNAAHQRSQSVSEDIKVQQQTAPGKEKSKGKKGSKCSKTKQQTLQNGISEFHVNENTSTGQISLNKMDGNEASKCAVSSSKDKRITSGGPSQAADTATLPKCGETASGTPEDSFRNVDCKLSSTGPKTQPSCTDAVKKQIRIQKSEVKIPLVASKEETTVSSEHQISTEDYKETTVKGQKNTPTERASESMKSVKYSENSEVGVTSTQCISKSHISPKKKDDYKRSGTASETKEGSHKIKLAKINEAGKMRLLQESNIQKECASEAHGAPHLSKQMHTAEFRSTHEENKKSEIPKNPSQSHATSAVPNIIDPPPPSSEEDRQSPPIPPPRRKKWQPNRRRSSERPPTPGRELESKKVVETLTDDSSSSSSHESEESVINLLSTIPSSNNQSAEIAQSLSEEEEGIIFDKSKVERASPSHRITTVPRDDLHTGAITSQKAQGDNDQKNTTNLSENPYTQKCISDYSQHISSRDQILQKLHTQVVSDIYAAQHDMASKIPSTLNMCAVDRFADILIHELLDDALVIAAVTAHKTKQIQPHHLSITEAVTQWLHSQNTENVLPVPKINDLETDDSDDTDASEENMTGPKNVYRNPLLASSCEKSKCDDAGIRVAISNESKLYKNKKLPKRNESIQKEGGEHCESVTLGSKLDSSSHQLQEIVQSKANNCIKYNENNGTRSDINDILVQQGFIEGKLDHSKEYTECSENDKCNLSFTDEPCEYDTDWECEPVLIKPTVQALTLVEDDQHVDTYLESPGDKCANMCNPTLSVAKYYRLGPPPQERKNGPKHTATSDASSRFSDCEEGLVEKEEEEDDGIDDVYIAGEYDTKGRKDAIKEHYSLCSSNEEDDSDIGCYENEVDALIHFKKELDGVNENSLPEVRRIPTSWSVDPIKIENKSFVNSVSNPDYNHQHADLYKLTYEECVTSDSGIQSEESSNEDGNKIDNNVPKPLPQTSVLHHKSALLVSRLCTEGSFPCGGICCILQ